MPRSVALRNAGLGVSLYNPTGTFSRWRLDYTDPFTGKRTQPGYHSLAEGTAAYEQAVAYVGAGRSAQPRSGARPTTAPRVDDVMERMVDRWTTKGRDAAYIEGRQGAYELRIRPLIGHLPVMEWGDDDRYCLLVMQSVRDAGLAPSTVQGYGAVLSACHCGAPVQVAPPHDGPDGRRGVRSGQVQPRQGAAVHRAEDAPLYGEGPRTDRGLHGRVGGRLEQQVARWLAKADDPRLVVVDTLAAVSEGVTGKQGEDRQLLDGPPTSPTATRTC